MGQRFFLGLYKPISELMGQIQSDSETLIKNKELLDKLLFILHESTPYYGELPVYRLSEKPFDYFLRYRETFISNEMAQSIIQNTRSLYESLEGHRNIVRVDILHLQKGKSIKMQPKICALTRSCLTLTPSTTTTHSKTRFFARKITIKCSGMRICSIYLAV